MRYGWILALSVTLAVAVGTYWYLRKNPGVVVKTVIELSGNGDEGNRAPVELTTEFDPTKNAPVFVIEGSDTERMILKLKIVWPQSREGEQVTSQINCSAGDIRINNTIVTREALFDKVSNSSKDTMVFSALCDDATCDQISRGCRLYTSGEK